MKKILSVMLCLLVLAGCDGNQDRYPALSKDTSGLTKSMRVFLQNAGADKVKGSLFQAEIHQMEVSQEDGFTRYVYVVWWAPVTERPIEIKTLEFQPAEDLTDYFQEQGTPYVQFKDVNLFFKNGFQGLSEHMKMDDVADMNAYSSAVDINNLGDAYQAQVGLSKGDMCAKMRDLQITMILASGEKETLQLHYSGDLLPAGILSDQDKQMLEPLG